MEICKMNVARIRMYTKENCGYCKATAALCKDRGIEIDEYDIQSTRVKAMLVNDYEKEFSTGARPKTVPQIWAEVNGEWEYVGGYEQFVAKLVPERF